MAQMLKLLTKSKLVDFRREVNRAERSHIADLEAKLQVAIKNQNKILCEELYWDNLQNYMNSCLTNTDFANRMINIYFDQITQIS